MKLDLGSFAFGSSITTGGNTPSWGTALGQQRPDLKFTYPGYDNIIIGMLYKSIPVDKVFIPLGKGGHICNSLEDEGIQLAAMFEKVYINGIIVNAPFIIVIYRDSSNSWDGRRTLKYNVKTEFRKTEHDIIRNSDFVTAARNALNITEDACWVISDIFIKNQDELHFIAGIVNPINSESYPSSELRKTAFLNAIKTTYDNHPQILKHFSSENSPIIKTIELTNAIKNINPSISSYLRAMRTKPFLLLAGISGTGKSRIVKQMAFDCCPDNSKLRKDATTPGNYCLVEVKPNWHDSSELIGYSSQIGRPHYEVTPFVRFLAKAMLYEEQRVPFFVCLDEMNLAPVEQYFAEFLSVLESRKVVNGRITSEAIISAEVFAKYEEQLKIDLFDIQQKEVGVTYQPSGTSDPEAHYGTENAVYNRLKNEGMRIPSNLIVIGTVNMDETTHQFSRKVIDRAMTIEMNLPEGEPFLDFFNNTRDLEYNDTPFPADLFLPSIVKAADAVEALAEDNAEKTEWLKKK